VFGHLLLGLIDLAAGVIALAWPGPTAYVLVILVAAWALVGGFAEVFAGFGSGETAGPRALFIIAGLVGRRSDAPAGQVARAAVPAEARRLSNPCLPAT
jgi:uncharacterized membrane protein HdeD (DUF308 family)